MRSHPAYKFDSVVSQEICYDLMVAIDEMWVDSPYVADIGQLTDGGSERGVREAPGVTPKHYAKRMSVVNGHANGAAV